MEAAISFEGIRDPNMGSMAKVLSLQDKALKNKTLLQRKLRGQFYTGSAVSNFMASWIQNSNQKHLRLLDAGAGTGILTVSSALHCLSKGCLSVHATLYESDAECMEYLEEAMVLVQDIFTVHQASFSFEIHHKDFIVARPDKDKTLKPFDIAVINPPYFKYKVKESPYGKCLSDLYSGDPNIYASFLAVTLACLRSGGEMIAITPRSFTNGLYFKGFRAYLLAQSTLHRIHVFKRRDKVFQKRSSSVLQENVICQFIKGSTSREVAITSSDCDALMNAVNSDKYPTSLIIDPSNDHQMIRVPETDEEASVLKQAESLQGTFEQSGYYISTGRVVEHRARKYVVEPSVTESSVPLYRPHNVTALKARWTGSHKKDVSFRLDNNCEKYILENQTYVLLKRFSSKDEKRRLVSGVYSAEDHNCEYVCFGNKVNYLGVQGETITDDEAYGLAAVLNSRFMDKYFRCISGNTQVNATEIRVMRFPSRDQVKQIGKKLKNLKIFDAHKVDLIVNKTLGIK